MNYYKNDITIVRGDTFSSGIILEGLGQAPDSIVFTCKDSLNDNGNVLFSKSLSSGITLQEYNEDDDIRKYSLRIPPTDTEDLQSGTFYYDLRVKVNTDTFTVMKGQFIIVQECAS